MNIYKLDDSRYLEFHGELPNKIMVMNVLYLVDEHKDFPEMAFLNECILMSKEALEKYKLVKYDKILIEYFEDFNEVFAKVDKYKRKCTTTKED